MGVKGVHICDRTGIKVLFDMDKVGKSEVFVLLKSSNFNVVACLLHEVSLFYLKIKFRLLTLTDSQFPFSPTPHS